MFKVNKTQLQLIIDKAKMLNCDIKTFVFDTDAIYNAAWSLRGVDVRKEVTSEETDYYKLNFFNKPHITMYLLISARYQQYLIVCIWGSVDNLTNITAKFLFPKEVKNELLEHVPSPENT